MQFAAAISAHRPQRQVIREFSGVANPRRPQGNIDEPRTIAHQIFDGVIRDEAFLQQFGAAVQHLPKNDGRELAVLQSFGGCRQIGPIGSGFENLVARVQEAAAAAGSAASALRVRTSYPASVTRTVCSHCADSDWSLVTTVQPSGSSLTSRRPALIMGSMVKVMPAVSSRPVPGLP